MPADPGDLIDVATATAYLAAGGLTPTAAQTAVMQSLVTAASKEFCRECRRYFALTSYDKVLTPLAGQPDKGEPDWLSLPCFPAQSVARVSGGRTAALTVANTSTATNQRATVTPTFTGDPEIQTTLTGLTLSRVASGVATSSALTFAANATVQALADAVNALGNGWTAAVAPTYGLWPSADLYAPTATLPALSPNGATLDLFADDLAAPVDLAQGTVTLPLYGTAGGPGGWNQWPGGTPEGVGSFRGPVRVQWTAGWATIPEPVQKATAAFVKAILEQLRTDSMLQSETADKYAYTLRQAWKSMPEWVRDTADRYRALGQ